MTLDRSFNHVSNSFLICEMQGTLGSALVYSEDYQDK
jgi:hypothetical protein